ncbi:hypothetical protein N9917_00080 [Deltaproteobacteria bacterium]|nr:hypothetical protein [Deltaproteobacteria bacterium]
MSERIYALMDGKHVWFDADQAYDPEPDGRLLVAVGKFEYEWFDQSNWSNQPLTGHPPPLPVWEVLET